jgi:hypothetical protein
MSDTTTKLTYLVGAKRLQEKNRDTEYLLSQEQLEMFEALARADERETCAKVCEELHLEGEDNTGLAADMIRARGNT